MKILLITTTYPTPLRPKQGAFNRVLVEALSAQHDVRVVAPIPFPQLRWPPSKASTRNSGDEVLHPVFWYPPKLLRQYYDQFYWQSISRCVHQLGREFSPDVVLGYWLHPDAAAALHAGRHFNVPTIVMSGGSDLKLLTNHPGRRRAILRVIAEAERLVVFSRELAARAARLGVPEDKTDVVRRGVDRKCFFPVERSLARAHCRIPEEAVVVFWAGRMAPVKNPFMLLEAAARWHAVYGNRLHFILAGDGPMRNRLAQHAKKLEIESVVHFAGNLSQSELAQRYNAANVTVLTSHSEGTPNVLLESIACGTPFVATSVGGVPEIASLPIDRLVPAGDLDAFTQAVCQAIEMPADAHRSAVPCDLPAMADQLEAVMARCPSLSKFFTVEPATPVHQLHAGTIPLRVPVSSTPVLPGEGQGSE